MSQKIQDLVKRRRERRERSFKPRSSKNRVLTLLILFVVAASLIVIIKLPTYFIAPLISTDISAPKSNSAFSTKIWAMKKKIGHNGSLEPWRNSQITEEETIHLFFNLPIPQNILVAFIDQQDKFYGYFPPQGAKSVKINAGQEIPLPVEISLNSSVNQSFQKGLILVVAADKEINSKAIEKMLLDQLPEINRKLSKTPPKKKSKGELPFVGKIKGARIYGKKIVANR